MFLVFSKELDFHGIPIKAHAVVSDEAMIEAYDRLAPPPDHHHQSVRSKG
jgi:hypothetical protein